MSNIILQALVNANRLDMSPQQRLSSGSCNVVQIHFIYDDDDTTWEGLGKTAVFYRKENEVYHVLLDGDLATVPREVLAEEGYVYFGLMGVSGDVINTTEVVRLTVYQGAITVPTNKSEEYTPDIYEQLLARVNQAVEMRGTANESIYPLEDEYITAGRIFTNGLAAAASFMIDGLTLSGYGFHETDGCILPELTPLIPLNGSIPVRCVNSDLDVSICVPRRGEDREWAYIKIINKTDQEVGIDGTFCECTWSLAAPYIGELADVRVGADGKTYGLAGEAVRAQIQDVLSRIHGGAAGRITHIDLTAEAWVQSANSTDLYSQVVAIDGVTEYSKIDLNPSVQQLAIFHEKDISFVAENEDGVVTVYCIGQKPTANYQMQITVSEVLING